MKRLLLSLVALVVLSCSAEAATCTWSGGTGNWDNTNTASWSCGHVPTPSDAVVFDGTSGGGTVTVCGASSANCPNGSGVVTANSITMGAFTGTLDFATNNPDVTIGSSFSGTGTATRTLNCGTGTFHFTSSGSVWDFTTNTNLTLSCGSFTLSFEDNGTGQTSIVLGTPPSNYGSLKFGPKTNSAYYTLISTTAVTFNGTLQATAPANIYIGLGANLTFTGGFNLVGTSTNPIMLYTATSSNGTSTLTVGAASTCTWCIFRAIVGATNTITATNSFSLSTNVGAGTLSITPPSTGGNGKIIGG